VFHKIQEICTKIGTRIFKIDQEMTEKIELKVATPQKVRLKMGEFEPPLKIFLFLKDEIYPLFSYSYWSKVPKWKCAHNLLCKMYKNCLKLLKIADLQPPDWIQRKKNTLYIWAKCCMLANQTERMSLFLVTSSSCRGHSSCIRSMKF